MAYNGGKAQPGAYHTIINQIPAHSTFIECFLGNGAITRFKRPADTTIGIEADGSVLQTYWRGDEVPGLQLVHANALDWLRSYSWTGGEFVYADPPYLFEVRSGGQASLYPYEFGEQIQHQALLDLLRCLPCPVMLSGYWSQLYADELRGWRTLTYQAVKRSGALATEWLWMNYPEPEQLHDYRYLGKDFRERERIKKLKARWIRRLQVMPTLQRQALMAALQEARDPTPSNGDVVEAISGDGDTVSGLYHHAERCVETSAPAPPARAIATGSHRQVCRAPRPSTAATMLQPDMNAIQEALL